MKQPEFDALVLLAECESVPVRVAVIGRLAELGALASGATDTLARCLSADSADVVSAAAVALGCIGPSANGGIPALLAVLRSDRPVFQAVKLEAAEALGKIGIASLAGLESELSCGVNYRIEVALRSIGVMGSAASALLPVIVPLARSSEWRVALESAKAIGAIGSGDHGAVEAMVQLMNHPVGEIKEQAVQALYAIGKPASSALPALRHAMSEGHLTQRIEACAAIGRIEGPSSELASFLIRQLFSGEFSMNYNRERIAEVIATMGNDAKCAILALSEALDACNEPDTVELAFIRTLGTIGDEQAVPALARKLENSGRKQRTAVQLALDEIMRRTAN